MSQSAPIKGPLVEAPLQFRLSPGGARASKNPSYVCPKCDAPSFVRRSERVTPTVTQLTVHCTNSACGHTFRADLVFVHSLCEGNIDRPDLDLPVCPKADLIHVRPPARDGPDDQISMFEPE